MVNSECKAFRVRLKQVIEKCVRLVQFDAEFRQRAFLEVSRVAGCQHDCFGCGIGFHRDQVMGTGSHVCVLG